MILPNKLIKFQDCVLAKTVFILNEISERSLSVSDLYCLVKDDFEDINQYILALDVLFTLNRINYDKKMQVIKYVEKDLL